MNTQSLSYRAAGVDIDAGEQLVERIKPLAQRTHRPGALGGLGGFGGVFELPWSDYQQPLLVTGTDGVGTKLKLAQRLNNHSSIGIDLVAMCVNDIVVCGAEPLLFLDYYATGQLNVDAAAEVIAGIAQGCEQAGAVLLGGETAEMPGVYQGDDYDLAGFAVGIVEKSKFIDGQRVRSGDCLVGLASSGVHANGFSLIRKILERSATELEAPFAEQTFAQELLRPTRIYVKSLLDLLQHVDVRAMAHITGGGLMDNVPRVLPQNTDAYIDPHQWIRPKIFDWLQEYGQLHATEMWRTFNCGIGMVVCVPQADLERTLERLLALGETAWAIGRIEPGSGPPKVIFDV